MGAKKRWKQERCFQVMLAYSVTETNENTANPQRTMQQSVLKPIVIAKL